MINAAPIDVMRGNVLFPSVGCIVTIPEPFVDTVRGRRLHMKIARMAAAETLKWHNRKIMPGHFIQTNRDKYKHKERKKGWKAYKKRVYRSITDLKASKASESKFKTAPPVKFAASPAESSVHAFMRYQWPFPKRGAPDPRIVTIFDMNSEVTRWTTEEIEQAAKIYEGHFVRIYLDELKSSPKLRREIIPKLTN